MRAKPHQRIIITRKQLEAMGACEGGIMAVESLLPAVISTDPEENIPLALAMVEHNCEWRMWWLWSTAKGRISDLRRYGRMKAAYLSAADLSGCEEGVPQLLAMMADSLLVHAKWRPYRSRK